jgi:hypothetical protein
MFVWICAMVAPERLGEYYSYLAFKSSSVGAVPGEYGRSSSKNRGPFHMGPKKQNGDFVQNGSSDVD